MLATAPVALAVKPQPPAVGTACQPDGKITGRGSNSQNALQEALILGYENDVCGPVTTADPDLDTAAYASDPTLAASSSTNTQNGMVAYNWGPTATLGAAQGLETLQCRDDDYGAADIPYTSEELSTLESTPSTTWSFADPTQTNPAGTCTLPSNVAPPYPPSPAGGYPNPSDAASNLLSFPVAAGAVAVGYNLNATVCPGGLPTYSPLDLPASSVDGIFQGEYATWNQVPVWDPATQTVDTAPLAGCTTPILRIVRSDVSVTAFALMTYLAHVDSSNSLCGEANTSWTSLAYNSSTGTTNDTTFPDQTGTAGSSCPDEAAQYVQGSGGGSSNKAGVVASVAATPGSISFAELSNWTGDKNQASNFALANIQTPASTGATPTGTSQFATPGTSSSNCSTSISSGIPSNSPAGAVGLVAGDTWAADQTSPANYSDPNPSFTGTNYPVCDFLFDFVYAGIGNESGEATPVTGSSETVAGPVQGLTNDQLRTLYSYFSYVFSPAAQTLLSAAGYDPLPTSWITSERTGFQDYF
jgi:ABC-type phosphate transport system substrate-binding protein